nr:JmjC domain-containing protein [Tanacetum cinerariifolium]
MIPANKNKIGRSFVVKEEEDGFETRRWSSRIKARPNYADDPFKHIVFDRKINPNKKPKKNPSSSSKKDTQKTSTDDGPSCPKKDTPSTNDVKQPSTSKVVRDGASTRPRYAAKHQVPDENGKLVYVESVKEKVNFEPSADQKIQYSIYNLHILFPFLKHLNEEHIKEKQIEAKIQGTFVIGL